MEGSRRTPAIASDDWMHEQQLRAQLEAEAWRRLRLELAQPALPAPPSPVEARPRSPHKSGSTLLKGLVRAGLGVIGGYLGYVSAMDSGLGAFEVWLAVPAGFVIALALSMFDPFRRIVHFLAETARWTLILTVGFGGLWLLLHPPA